MRKKNFKGRCEKRKLSKCEDVCRTFDAIQYAYADLLNGSADIKSFQVNTAMGKKHIRNAGQNLKTGIG